VPPPLPLAAGYSYWREDHFRRFVAALADVDNDDLKDRLQSDLNPHEARPPYLKLRHR
jgi:hypothetical protein